MRRVVLLMFLGGCYTAESPSPVVIKEPVKYEVRAGLWTSCWVSCGKRDNLLAVTEAACICRDGKRFVHAFPVEEVTNSNTATVTKAAEPEKPKEPTKSVFDMLKSVGD